MNQYHIVYGNMKNRTIYYKERPIDDYHFYNGTILNRVKVVQYAVTFEGGYSTSAIYDIDNHDKIIPPNERNDGILFKKDLKISLKNNTKDGIFFDNFYNFITCIHGYVFLSVIDLIESSNTYMKEESFILSTENPIQVLIPPFHGFVYKALEDSILIDKLAYKSIDTISQNKLQLDNIKINWP